MRSARMVVSTIFITFLMALLSPAAHSEDFTCLTCRHEIIMTFSIDRDLSVEAFEALLGPNWTFLRNDLGYNDAEILEYMKVAAEFFKEDFGVTFSKLSAIYPSGAEGEEGALILEWLSDDGNFRLESSSFSTSSGLPGPTIFRTTDSRFAREDDKCVLVLDGGARVVAISEDARWGGTFGQEYSTDGTGTVPARLFEAILFGKYVMRDSLHVSDGDGDGDGVGDLVINYRSFAPMETTPYGSTTLNCDLRSEIGDGRMVGAFRAEPNMDEEGNIISFRFRDHQTLQLDRNLDEAFSSCPEYVMPGIE